MRFYTKSKISKVIHKYYNVVYYRKAVISWQMVRN